MPVRRGTITQTISTSGTTVSTRQVKLNFASGGKIKDVYVKLGDKLTVGQAIAALDPAPFQLKIENAQSSVRQAQIKVQQLRDGATPEEIAASQAAFEAAQTKFQEVANGPTAADIQAARSLAGLGDPNQTSAQAKLDALMAGPKADEVAAAHKLARIGPGLAGDGRGEAGRPEGRPEAGRAGGGRRAASSRPARACAAPRPSSTCW